jgi:hypothetical protein
MGKAGQKDGGKAEEEAKTAGDKLWVDSDGSLGEFSVGVWGGQTRSREGAHSGDRGEQLPDEAPDTACLSEDLLFFEEGIESFESI